MRHIETFSHKRRRFSDQQQHAVNDPHNRGYRGGGVALLITVVGALLVAFLGIALALYHARGLH